MIKNSDYYLSNPIFAFNCYSLETILLLKPLDP